MPQRTAELLQPFRLFDGLEPADLEPIIGQVQERRYSRGQMLFQQGSTSDEIYFIRSGQLIALTHTNDGREIIFEHANPGSYIGEIAALDDSPRALSVYARAETTAIIVRKQTFLELIDTQPSVRKRLIKDLIERIRALTERSYQATVYSVEDRVRVRLSRLFLEANSLAPGGALDNAPTHEEIASSIGANREAVSRSLSKLKQAGIIETGRKQLMVLLPDKLLAGLV